MPEGTQTTQPSGLAALVQKYGQLSERATPREEAHQTFDSNRTYRDDRRYAEQQVSGKKRLSQGPGEKVDNNDFHVVFAGICLDLVDIIEEHGMLTSNFSDVIGKRKYLSPGQWLKVKLYSAIGAKQKATTVKKDAVTQKNKNLNIVVDRIADVVDNLYQKSVQAREKVTEAMSKNIDYRKEKDKALIERIRDSYHGGADEALAVEELRKLEVELGDIEKIVEDYDDKIFKAKKENNLPEVNRLTDEVLQTLEYKHEVLDGKVAADGVVSEIRRKMLDSAAGIKSAREALVRSKENYEVFRGLLDTISRQEILYKYEREDMVEIYREQATAAIMGLEDLDRSDALDKLSATSEKLAEANAKLLLHLYRVTSEQLYNPRVDREASERRIHEIKTMRAEIEQKDREFVEATQRLRSPQEPAYVQRR